VLIRLILVIAAASACDTNKPVSSGYSETSGGGGNNPGPAQDWTGKKLISQTGSVDDIPFTIDVPEGLPRDGKQTGDWGDSKGTLERAPKIVTWTIEIRRVQSLDDAKYNATTSSRTKTWVRNDARPDGWAVTYAEPDKTRVEAITYRQANDTHYVKCKAFQDGGDGALPNHAKTVAMLEKVCDSLKPGQPAPKPAAAPGEE